MSRKFRKYARSMERRIDILEEWVKFTRGELGTCGSKLDEIEDTLNHHRTAHNDEVILRTREGIRTDREIRHNRRKIERAIDSQRVNLLITTALSIAALIVAVKAMA